MFGATDWALKRVFKFLLKRHLGRLLRSEVDLEQLDVQLGTGTLELRSVLLNCDHLNEQLGSSFWEITAGYVGSVKATIPITSLHSDSCTAELDEVLITVKARMAAATAQPSGHSAEPAELAGAASSAFEVDDLGLGGPATITDGVKLIAGGIEKVLQQLQLKAHRIAVRVELPNPNGREGPAALVVLRLEHFSYAGESSPPLQAPIPVGQAASLQLLKVISFEGLTVELFEDVQEAAETDGLLGQLEEALTTQSMLETGELPPYALDDFAIGETASTASRSDSSPGSGDDTQHVIICSNDGIGCAGQLKLLLTWHGTYHLHPHISADLQLEPLQVQFHPHHLPLLADLIRASTSELSFVLWYPDPEQHAQQAQHEAQHPSQPTNDAAHAMSRNDQARPDNARTSSSTTASIKGNAAQNVCPDADPSLPYRARFSVECGDLSLALASTGKDLSCSLQLYRLEAVEHIAAQGAGVYSAAAALAELTRLPEVLPMSAYGPRPVPSFTGVSILPLRRSLYSSTLSQLSCMSASAGPVSPSSPQVQVWPVLCCAGGRRAEASVPSLSLSLQRLQSFFEPLLSMTAASIPARPATPPPAPKVSSKAAVARAIDSILDDLQEFRPEEPRPRFGGFGGSVKVDVSAPHVCAIVLLSPGSAGSNSDSKSSALPTSSHGYSYLAIDVFESEDDNAALPMISLRSGDAASPSGVAPPAGAMVEAEVAVGRAKVYLVGCSHGSEGSPRQPAQPRRLQANCVLDVVPAHHPSDAAPGPALSADLRWSPSATASPLLIHDAWDHVQSRSGSAKGGGAAGGAAGQENAHLDSVQFQESAIAASGMYLHVRAVEVLIDLSQADLAALWHLADAYLRWRAQTVAAALNASNDLHSDGFDSLAAVVPSQCAILLEGGFRCNLRHGPQGTQVDMGARDGAVFLVDAAQVRVFSVSSLGSSVDAGTTSVFCQGVSVANGDTRASLLYCPPESCSTSSRSCPCIEVLHVQRAIDLATSRHPTRTFTLGAETEALGAACIRGTTFATDEGDLALSWVSRLIGFFAVNYAEEAAEEAPTTITSWSVNLQDVAVRYEPPSFLSEPPATPSSPSTPPAPPMTDPVAAVLLLGFLHWHTPAAETHPEEGAIQIIIKAEADNDGLWELEVQNQRLYSPLSKAGLKHLLALAAQWAAQYADEPGAGAHEELEADRDGRDSRVGSGQGAQRAGRSSSSGRSRRTPRGSSVGATTPVRVMDGVEEDAFRREPTATQDLAASVFLDGGWYEDGIMHSAAHSVAHSTQSAGPGIPVILEDFFVPDALGSDCTSTFGEDMELEERGIWYGNEEDENAPPSVNDDHFPTPTEEEVQAARMGGALGRGALGPLPEGFPAPVLRITLRDIKCVVALCRADEPGSPTASHAGRIELDVTGLCVQADTFAPADQYARRTAVSIHHLEIRDCAVWPDAGSGWRRMLSLHTNMRTPRDASACMFQAELEAVRPSAGAGSGAEEYRLHVSLLPLRVRLDQNVVTFLQAFFSDPSARLGPPEADLLDTESEAGSAAADDEGGSFFQRCEIRPFSVVVDYRPRHVDVAALRAGNLAEVLNLVPWGGVALDLPHVKLTGLHGWAALGAAVGTDYLKDVASSQAHKFVVGVAPIRSVCKVGSAAAQLFAIPADSLRAAPNRSDVSFSRQMRRSLTGFVRAVTLEALGLGASVAGGAHLVLQGGVGSTSDQPAGMAEGLRQAASKMSSGLESAAAALVYRPVRSIQGGEGVGTAVVRALRAAPAAAVAPLSAAADAARAALLGARNALDPERYEERRS
ncbi:hypothetical protein WJX72_002557 [[Myrmecia] bisecta]|uniref:Autophagy-related protein 2 n=1 Tax=[Myrmecia] bisecta TaxID=41462 RepID=A0AAW1PBT4_9CHLO